MSGRIDVICGPMFSGKTEELIRRLKRLKFANKQYILYKPKKDNRYSDTDVLTHEQEGLPAESVSCANDILVHLSTIDPENYPQVIAVDEAQFFEYHEQANLVAVLTLLKQQGFKVIVNGLDMDFMGNPWKIMGEIMAISDDIAKIKSICCVCGEDASMSYRIDSKLEKLEELGGNESYQARCYVHWKKGMTESGR